MTTASAQRRPRIEPISFEGIAGIISIAVGIGGLAYSIAFVTYLKTGSTAGAKLATTLLLGGGILGVPVFVAIHQRLRAAEPALALTALIFGAFGSAGSAIHGGYDLANFIKPPVAVPAGLPNAVDPRGLMTFGFIGIALFVVAWAITRTTVFPRALGLLGFAGALLLAMVYFGRLIILNPKSPGVLVAAVLSGFIVNPVWFVWLGTILRRESASTAPGG
jgi:hypothetical protein